MWICLYFFSWKCLEAKLLAYGIALYLASSGLLGSDFLGEATFKSIHIQNSLYEHKHYLRCAITLVSYETCYFYCRKSQELLLMV